MRYIIVIDGHAIATNGCLVHTIRAPELENGLYELQGIKLVKVNDFKIPANYNPKRVVSEIVFIHHSKFKTKTMQDFKPTFFKNLLKLKGDNCSFSRDYLLRATNHNERNAFDFAKVKDTGFLFGCNEFGHFFLLGLKQPNLATRLKTLLLISKTFFQKTSGDDAKRNTRIHYYE